MRHEDAKQQIGDAYVLGDDTKDPEDDEANAHVHSENNAHKEWAQFAQSAEELFHAVRIKT